MSLRQRIAAFIGGRDYQNAGVEVSKELWEALDARAGGKMSWQKAIQVSAVLSCARIISNDICSVPWKIMKDGAGGKKVEDREHPLWELVTYAPNSWQNSFEFRKTMGMHLALESNAFVWLDRVGPREEKIVGMLPLEPSWVQVKRNSADWTKIEYWVTFPDGTMIVTDSRFIWHIKNHTWDSYKGLSALSYARDAMGLSKDIEKGQSDTHKFVARPAGVLAIDQEMTPEQFKETRKLIDAQVGTRLHKGLPLVVDKTMTWTQMALKAVDMQTIESRGFQIEEVGRAMGILPIMLGYSGDKSATYASAEQMFIHHFTTSTRVWHQNFMQSADRWLLTPRERRAGYYNHLVDQALLRGDSKARGEFYRLLWMIGAVTGNEIRQFEDMNRIEGLDRPWAPLANAPIGEDGMPMIADDRTDIDKALQNESALKELGTAFRNASPMARQMFLSHLASETGPQPD